MFLRVSVRQSGILYVFMSLSETKWTFVCFCESECENWLKLIKNWFRNWLKIASKLAHNWFENVSKLV